MASYCETALGHPVHGPFHDLEYGFPIDEEPRLFERMTLEIFQAGLSWLIILKKREAFRLAFENYDVDRIAAFDQADLARLMNDPSIIRNRRKIEATITNARATVALRDDGGLAELIWSFQPEETPAPTSYDEIPSQSAESRALAKALRARGFVFVGPTTMFALLEAVGVIDTHLVGSHRRGTSGVWTGR